jgi:hypothetical protein
LLEDSDWSHWSDRQIAKQTSTSHPFVAKIRSELTGNISSEKNNQNVTGNISSEQTERTYITKHGTTAQMNTANIGKGKSSESLPPSAEDKELTLKSEEGISPTSSEEINHPSDARADNTPTDNEPPNIRNLLSEGDRVRIKDNHKFGGQFGIVTLIPNRKCAVVEFSPGFRKVIQLEDFDFSDQPQPQQPQKKEIIIQEGLNYFAGSPCKWYVEVEEKTYLRLQEYREKVGTVTLDAAIGRFLEKENNQKPINSDDICLGLTSNLEQLTDERVRFVVTAIAQSRPKIICQVAEAVRTNNWMEKN